MTKPIITKIIIITISGIILLTLTAAGIFTYYSLFGAPEKQTEPERFIVSQNTKTQDTIKKLHDQGLIKSEWALNYALKRKEIESGGYKISKSMNVWEMTKALTQEPYMKWVVIPEGLRKEQIADLIGDALGWTDQQKSDWINKYTAMKYDETEGIYFPDTYLLPKDETGLQIADRLRAKFNEKFQPYADRCIKENVKWTTALKIASLVQREAANKADMPLIAGIIWNRLLNDPPMKLEIDATVQYALGESGNWWPKIRPADYKTESDYNTYLHTGLPPHPICNPGLDAIHAVLNPDETDCLYYLHDSNGQTHCTKTYEEHKLNIEKYLK
ncbi:MAG: endolytic transglycosylase MltG [Candidatus Paceibacterota bacterium]|jgi:UPF0755 protein